MNRYAITVLAIVLACACTFYAQNPQPAQSAPPAQAAPTANPVSAEIKQMYNGIKNNLTKMAEKMPEESYSFKATPEVRTFGELIAHVADSQARTCSALNGEPKAVNAASKRTKAYLVAALKESFSFCDKVLDSLTDAKAVEMVTMGNRQRSRIGALAGLISHSNEEYGYMAVYMRLKGVVPPSSEPR